MKRDKLYHDYESAINNKATDFARQYAMPNMHFEDLKEAYVQGLLEALDGYEKEKGPFVSYAERRGERAMHEYVRTMRTGCTVPSDPERGAEYARSGAGTHDRQRGRADGVRQSERRAERTVLSGV